MKDKFEEVFNEFLKKKQEYGNVDETTIQTLSVLFPESIPVKKYGDIIFMIRVLEKLARITSINIDGEKKLDAYKDTIGYSLLGFMKNSKKIK